MEIHINIIKSSRLCIQKHVSSTIATLSLVVGGSRILNQSWIPLERRYQRVRDINRRESGQGNIDINANEDQLEIIVKYSSLTKLIRTIATCIRFAHNCKNKVKKIGALLVPELNTAEANILQLMQSHEFPAEIIALKNKTQIKKTSQLLTFNPFLDGEGILRVGGRIQNSQVRYSQKHPIILPSSNHLTQLYINDAHIRSEHGGIAATVTLLRQRFWIIRT